MQRMQMIISEDKAFSFSSTEVPFAANLVALDHIINTYTTTQIQLLNSFVGHLDSAKQQQLISGKIYELFIEKYQSLTQLVVSDSPREALLANIKIEFLNEWNKILKIEGPKNFLIIQHLRLENQEEKRLKNQFLNLFQQLALMCDKEELGSQAIAVTQALQKLAIAIINTASTYVSITYNLTKANEASRFARLHQQDVEEKINHEAVTFRQNTALVENEIQDIMRTYRQVYTEDIRQSLKRLEQYPAEIDRFKQMLGEKKAHLSQDISTEALTLTSINHLCLQTENFQQENKTTENQLLNSLSFDLKNVPNHNTQFETNIRRKHVMISDHLKRLLSELKKLAGTVQYKKNKTPFANALNNMHKAIHNSVSQLQAYVTDLEREKKGIFAKRDIHQSTMNQAMQQHFTEYETLLYKLMMLLVKLELPSLETEENRGPLQKFCQELKQALEQLKKQAKSVLPTWNKLREERLDHQSTKTTEDLSFVQKQIDLLNTQINTLGGLPNKMIMEELAKISLLKQNMQKFHDDVEAILITVKKYKDKTPQYFLKDSFKTLGNCVSLMAPVLKQKLLLTKKIQEILQKEKIYQDRSQLLIGNELTHLNHQYAKELERADNTKILAHLTERYTHAQKICLEATSNLTEHPEAALQKIALLLDHTQKTLPLLCKDFEKFKKKLAKEQVARKQEEERRKTLHDTLLWQSVKNMKSDDKASLSYEDKINFLKMETEQYHHHLLKQGRSGKIKKDITIRLLQLLQADVEDQIKFHHFEALFLPHEMALRAPRENAFIKSMKSFITFILPFKSIKDRLHRVQGALYADLVKSLLVPNKETQVEAIPETIEETTPGLNTADLMQAMVVATPDEKKCSELTTCQMQQPQDECIVEHISHENKPNILALTQVADKVGEQTEKKISTEPTVKHVRQF